MLTAWRPAEYSPCSPRRSRRFHVERLKRRKEQRSEELAVFRKSRARRTGREQNHRENFMRAFRSVYRRTAASATPNFDDFQRALIGDFLAISLATGVPVTLVLDRIRLSRSRETRRKDKGTHSESRRKIRRRVLWRNEKHTELTKDSSINFVET